MQQKESVTRHFQPYFITDSYTKDKWKDVRMAGTTVNKKRDEICVDHTINSACGQLNKNEDIG